MHANSYVQVSDEVGDPEGQVIILGNTARCGSTLLCQMFSKIPNTRVMSEPWALAHLHSMFQRDKIGTEENRRLIRAVIRVQLKGSSEGITDLTLVKFPPFNLPQMRLIKELFPSFKFIFNTRDLPASLNSLKKMFLNGRFFSRMLRTSNVFWCNHAPLPYGDERAK